jgi:hypothetical protein
MNLSNTMNRMRKMMPGRKQGMSTGSKVLLIAVPVVMYAVGKMISSRMYG